MSAKLELNRIEVASPCPARWEDMTGDERSRFCQHCQKHVFNFSAMTRVEAEQLIVEKEGNLCARMYRRKDGTVLTADCPVGQKMTWGQRRKKALAAVAGVVLFVGAVLAARLNNEDAGRESKVVAKIRENWRDFTIWLGVATPPPQMPPPVLVPQMVMGAICVNPQPPKTSVSTTGVSATQPGQPKVAQTGAGQQP